MCGSLCDCVSHHRRLITPATLQPSTFNQGARNLRTIFPRTLLSAIGALRPLVRLAFSSSSGLARAHRTAPPLCRCFRAAVPLAPRPLHRLWTMKEAKQRDIASFFGGKPLQPKENKAASKKGGGKAAASTKAAAKDASEASPAAEAAAPAKTLKRLRKAGDAAAEQVRRCSGCMRPPLVSLLSSCGTKLSLALSRRPLAPSLF